jgi:hypothetical protein
MVYGNLKWFRVVEYCLKLFRMVSDGFWWADVCFVFQCLLVLWASGLRPLAFLNSLRVLARVLGRMLVLSSSACLFFGQVQYAGHRQRGTPDTIGSPGRGGN